MLSYMLPVEEKSQNTRNLSLNLNLQNTTSTTPSQHSSDTDQHEHDDLIDENTQLLNIERQDYVATTRLNGNGNLIKNGGNKVNYNMNITNNNLCNNNFNNNNNHNSNSIIKNGDSTKMAKEMDTVVATNNNLNNLNNNEETNSSNSDKKIIKMTKLNKNVTLKR